MMLGCPIVASYVGGTMDKLEHGREGYLYQVSSVEMLAHYVNKVFNNTNMELKKDITKNCSKKSKSNT